MIPTANKPRAFSISAFQLSAFCLTLSLLLPLTPLPAQPAPSPFRPIEPVKARGNTTSIDEAQIPGKIRDRVQTFFATLTTQSVEQAFFKLFDGTQFMDQKNAIDSFSNATRGSIEAYGKVKYHDLFETRKVGERIIIVSYIVEHEKRPIRWRFLFYSPVGNEWTLANLKVDDLRNYFPAIPSAAKPPEPVFLKNEKFFINLQSGATEEAFADLVKGTELAGQTEIIRSFVEKAKQSDAEYGKIASFNLLDNRPLNPRHRLLTYIGATEKEPLRWQFSYKLDPQTGIWILTNVRLDDLFDESFLID
jgi:hypothetical protein